MHETTVRRKRKNREKCDIKVSGKKGKKGICHYRCDECEI